MILVTIFMLCGKPLMIQEVELDTQKISVYRVTPLTEATFRARFKVNVKDVPSKLVLDDVLGGMCS